MWTIYEEKSLFEEIKKIPVHVLRHYEVLKRIIEIDGLQGVELVSGFHDKAIKNALDGFISLMLSPEWFVICSVNKEKQEVFMIDVNQHSVTDEKTVRDNAKNFEMAHVRAHLTPGETLKMLRELQGISQNALVKMCGIRQANISAIENNKSTLGMERAVLFAKVLKVHPAVLLFPDFDMREVA